MSSNRQLYRNYLNIIRNEQSFESGVTVNSQDDVLTVGRIDRESLAGERKQAGCHYRMIKTVFAVNTKTQKCMKPKPGLVSQDLPSDRAALH